MELREIAKGVFAWLVEDRGWGWSNAGLVAAGGGLMVDTFMDVARTRRALSLMAERGLAEPRRLLNTHHNADHCWGNRLFRGREIIAHRRCAELMSEDLGPAAIRAMVAAGSQASPGLRWFADDVRAFDFSDVEVEPPNRLLDGDTDLDLGDVPARALYVGPAHTAGDLVVHLPEQGVLFAGDVIFRRCTPIGWQGTFASWRAALDRIVALAPEVIVPGHGPLCGVEGAREMHDYLGYVFEESRHLHARGVRMEEAAGRIDLGPYAEWTQPERLVFNVARAYRELAGGPADAPLDMPALLDQAVALRTRWGRSGGGS